MSRQQQQREREDVPRISVDTLHDWERVKASYTDAAMSELEERMNGGKEGGGRRSEGEKEILRAHLRKVRLHECLRSRKGGGEGSSAKSHVMCSL